MIYVEWVRLTSQSLNFRFHDYRIYCGNSTICDPVLQMNLFEYFMPTPDLAELSRGQIKQTVGILINVPTTERSLPPFVRGPPGPGAPFLPSLHLFLPSFVV